MDKTAKTKTVGVFENVVTQERCKRKKKFKTHRFSDDDSSPSESDLVIDDSEETLKRKKTQQTGVRVRLKEETLNLACQWLECSEHFEDETSFYCHLSSHVTENDDLKCKWSDCPDPNAQPMSALLERHLTYHGYVAKLISIGQNVVNRNNFPDCSLPKKYTVDVPPMTTYYECEWQGCEHVKTNTFGDLLAHVQCHVMAAPTGKKAGQKCVVPCLWKCCSMQFNSRYKLADHLKIHTKERVVGCPTCYSLFSSKTTFSDHRKRQMQSYMRSYQCSQCLKLFSVERLLSDHMRSHINQYKCNLCDMTSPKPSMLAKHYRYRHMSVRPFNCHICNKSFVTKSNLNTHLLTHEDKPFKCDQCEFGCKSKVGLKNHMLKVHGLMDASKYECQVCKVLFKRGDYLTYHLINRHNFHWPSGHSRFRYRKDTDGIFRLQTVRYESIEVTEQMIQSESQQAANNPSAVVYNVTCDEDDYKLTIEEHEVNERISDPATSSNKVIIVFEDLDEEGNVILKKEIDTNNLFVSEGDGEVQEEKKVLASRNMPHFEQVYLKNWPHILEHDDTKCDFPYASDLVSFIKANFQDDFSVGIAGYPNGHPHCKTLEEDMEHLKKKVDSGADFIVTQATFCYDTLEQFAARCLENDIKVPILPGVLVIKSYKTLLTIARCCEFKVAEHVFAFVKENREKPEVVENYGLELAAQLVAKSWAHPGLLAGAHIFTMNDLGEVNKVLAKVSEQV
ncbi:histone H4 transcription factor-like [Anthonomus grandis grandis]|uniref:histone H4 transcription factor-like n=1 Tax=Anthonomus grandis grandis TaxID=2921223 RepID=UPI0021662AC0|nr:histone H4 transcription factor-like [Anthonomus grandis grandis]